MPGKVHDAQGQGVIRANNGEVGLFLGQGEQAGQIVGGNVDALDQGAAFCQPFVGDAGIARRGPELGDMRGLGQLPNQRVLAATGANHEEFHHGIEAEASGDARGNL